MNRLRFFYTCMLPENLIKEHGLSTAACNFSFNLMSGGCFDHVFSVMGTNHDEGMSEEAFTDKRFELVFCARLRSLGRIGRLLAVIVEQWRVFKKIPNGSSIWFYNLDVLSIFLFILLRLFKRTVLTNIIVLDFTPSSKRFSYPSLCLSLINKAHGRICLSYSPLFERNNSITLPGVVPSSVGNEPHIKQPNNRFLLSGALYENIAQTTMVLKAFSQLPQCELHITGVIDDDSLLNYYSSKFSNILWHGQVSFAEYIAILHSCTFQLSTRDASYPENMCNFPSKIIEALLHNRIVISTIEYKQLLDVKYIVVNSELELFISQIKDINEMSEPQVMLYANQGKKVAEMFSTDVWNKTMSKIENMKI